MTKARILCWTATLFFAAHTAHAKHYQAGSTRSPLSKSAEEFQLKLESAADLAATLPQSPKITQLREILGQLAVEAKTLRIDTAVACTPSGTATLGPECIKRRREIAAEILNREGLSRDQKLDLLAIAEGCAISTALPAPNLRTQGSVLEDGRGLDSPPPSIGGYVVVPIPGTETPPIKDAKP